MRRLRYICVLITSVLCLIAAPAYASARITVTIPVTIEGGGVAVMVPGGGSPSPEEGELSVEPGKQAQFSIPVEKPGTYGYEIAVKDEGEENVVYDKTVYVATVSVFDNGGESPSWTVTLSKAGSEEKPESVHFAMKSMAGDPGSTPADNTEPDGSSESADDEPGSDSEQDEGADDGADDDDVKADGTDARTSSSGSNPKTGDSSNLERYLLISVAASAGLFALALVYAVSTRRLSEKRRSIRKE